LKYLLDVDTQVSSSVSTHAKKDDLLKEIGDIRKSALEKFLDIVSIEFNKHDLRNIEMDNIPLQNVKPLATEGGIKTVKTGNETASAVLPDDNSPFQVSVLNIFIQIIDIEILSVWTNEQAVQPEVEAVDIQTISQNMFKGARSLFLNASKVTSEKIDDKFKSLEPNHSDDVSDDDVNATLSRDIMVYSKKSIVRDEFTVPRKVPNEFYNLNLIDLTDIIDQLYIFMSVIFSVGIMGKRPSWGRSHIAYLDKQSKFALKKWCKLEASFDYQEADFEPTGEELKSGSSLELESSNKYLMVNSEGWMNLSNTHSIMNLMTSSKDEIYNKLNLEIDILRKENEAITNANSKTETVNEELTVKVESLYSMVEMLTKELSERSDELREVKTVKDELLVMKGEVMILQAQKEDDNMMIDKLQAQFKDREKELGRALKASEETGKYMKLWDASKRRVRDLEEMLDAKQLELDSMSVESKRAVDEVIADGDVKLRVLEKRLQKQSEELEGVQELKENSNNRSLEVASVVAQLREEGRHHIDLQLRILCDGDVNLLNENSDDQLQPFTSELCTEENITVSMKLFFIALEDKARLHQLLLDANDQNFRVLENYEKLKGCVGRVLQRYRSNVKVIDALVRNDRRIFHELTTLDSATEVLLTMVERIIDALQKDEEAVFRLHPTVLQNLHYLREQIRGMRARFSKVNKKREIVVKEQKVEFMGEDSSAEEDNGVDDAQERGEKDGNDVCSETKIGAASTMVTQVSGSEETRVDQASLA
jgi:hypothetical protein